MAKRKVGQSSQRRGSPRKAGSKKTHQTTRRIPEREPDTHQEASLEKQPQKRAGRRSRNPPPPRPSAPFSMLQPCYPGSWRAHRKVIKHRHDVVGPEYLRALKESPEASRAGSASASPSFLPPSTKRRVRANAPTEPTTAAMVIIQEPLAAVAISPEDITARIAAGHPSAVIPLASIASACCPVIDKHLAELSERCIDVRSNGASSAVWTASGSTRRRLC